MCVIIDKTIQVDFMEIIRQDINVIHEIRVDGEYIDIKSDKAVIYLAPIKEAIAYASSQQDHKMTDFMIKELGDLLAAISRYKVSAPKSCD